MKDKILVSLPGFHNNLKLNLLIIDLLKEHPEYFYDNIVIDSVYDAFPCKWTAGRGMVSWEFALKDYSEIREIITPILERGVRVRYNFTNSLLTEKYNDDEVGNAILKETLKIVKEYGSKLDITVASPSLRDYLKKNFGDDINLIWSTTLGKLSIDDINEKTKEDCLVLDFTYNKNFKLINQLEHPENIEILANEHCQLDCPYRDAHWKWISQVHLLYPKVMTVDTSCMNRENMKKLNDAQDYSIHVNDVNAFDMDYIYAPFNIKRLKLCGRMEYDQGLIWDYARLLIKPAYQPEVIKMFIEKVGERYNKEESRIKYWDEQHMRLYGTHYNPEDDKGYQDFLKKSENYLTGEK